MRHTQLAAELAWETLLAVFQSGRRLLRLRACQKRIRLLRVQSAVHTTSEQPAQVSAEAPRAILLALHWIQRGHRLHQGQVESRPAHARDTHLLWLFGHEWEQILLPNSLWSESKVFVCWPCSNSSGCQVSSECSNTQVAKHFVQWKSCVEWGGLFGRVVGHRAVGLLE